MGAGATTTALPPASQQPTTGASVTSGTTTEASPSVEKAAANDDKDADDDADDGKVMMTEVTDNSLLKDEPIDAKNFTSKLGVYENAAVCSDKPVCSQIGR